MSKFVIHFLLSVCLSVMVARAWADDSSQLQLGMMYAEHIRGVGLYAGLEAEGLLPNASAYIDATLLASDAYDPAEPIFGGISVGLRSVLPVPLSPYVGAGIYMGKNEKEVRGDNDKIDNDGNGLVDEFGEMKTADSFMAAIYPEVGWRLTIGDSFTVRMMGRYMASSFGRTHDDWFYGVSLAFGHE